MSEENNGIYEIDPEQLEQLIGATEDSDKLPPIEIPMEFYDSDEFHRGIKETSYLSGVVTALLNVGVSEQFVLDYLLSKETIKQNIEINQMNKDMNIEVSKNQKAVQEKYEL